MRDAHDGIIRVGNRPERSEEMVAAIDECLATVVLDIRRLQKLRGRILFARSPCYGRFAASALRALQVLLRHRA